MPPLNHLYCGDNLDVLRHCIADGSVDLIYLDPPFKKCDIYNVLFRQKDGSKSESQKMAFEKAWEWNLEAERNYAAVADKGGKLAQIMEQFRTMFPDSDMLAYLSMMAPRLVELRRVLKATGSIYLHCDPTASHYLKMLMDGVFQPDNFRNEIIWERTTGRKGEKQFGRVHDVLLFYSKTGNNTWRCPTVPQTESSARGHDLLTDAGGVYRLSDLTGAGQGPPRLFDGVEIAPPVGRHWAYDQEGVDTLWREGRVVFSRGGKPRLKNYIKTLTGVAVRDVWTDIQPLNSAAAERLGYPTQKPEALLERIINASSNVGDVVLDPFCGCGTAIAVAERLKRHWIGIDITIEAMRVTRNERLSASVNYYTIYRPCDMASAEVFAAEQPFGFQDWAVDKLHGIPSRQRSGDRGVDGRLYFRDAADGPLRQILVSVKGGKLKAPFVLELQGAVARERAPMGILITLGQPSKQMIRNAASSGFYTCSSGMYPKIQIITVRDILDNARFELPPIERIEGAKKRPLAVAAASQIPLPGIAN